MKRVSSRQRIVSWDDFDAVHHESSSEDEDYAYDEGKSRKRERLQTPFINPSFSPTLAATNLAISLVLDSPPTNIPAFSWELPKKGHQELYLDDLPTDIHVSLLSFLDVSDIRAMMSINHKFRTMLCSVDAHSFWMTKCKQLWPALPSSSSQMRLVDTLNLPTVAGAFAEYGVNLPLLMTMTPSILPTGVDERLFQSCSRISRRRQAIFAMRNDTVETNDLIALNDESTGRRCIRYTGLVGSGDRCIRSDHPLPKPKRKLDSKEKKFYEKEHPSLFKLLCRGSKAIRGICLNNWRPFVAPYVGSDNSIHVTPRMVAYFEVGIASKSAGSPHRPIVPETKRDCVAVGIATESFTCHSRMPGWDTLSFAYHGDDGGIFHASGGMVERFGPCFGSGDTVGCGIDYIARGIFFTLNGKFMGYGWKQIDVEFLENNLYAVVGIDTNDDISINYGDKPFEFDLTEFTSKHICMIAPYYKLSGELPVDYLPSYPEI
jgi:hypothetical protein